MGSRSERIQGITQQYGPVVGKVRSFAEGVITPSIDSLEDKKVRSKAITIFLRGILERPQTIEFCGQTLAQYNQEFRNNLGNELYRYGLRQFGE